MAGKQVFQKSACSPDQHDQLSGEEISRLPQYHPHLQKHMVKEVMSPFARQPGSYLIRRSQSLQGAYTVSVMHTDLHLYHIPILQQDRTYGVTPDQVFPSMAAMLDYYSHHDIPGSNVKHIRLRNPICQHPVQAARQERELDFSAERKPSERYVSRPLAGVKGSPLQQKQQGLPSRPQKPPTDDMFADHHDVPHDAKPRQPSTLMSQDEDVDGACSCGIPHQMAHLPHGWEVHRVHHKEDASNFGKLFFHNRTTEETSWTLPSSVSSQLTEESRRNLDHLESKGGEFFENSENVD
ncbi:PREDICTED: GRB2-related adapter protein 2-like isoform X1 [Branchiostoma belcheri]|uniref:GRB2-related adapter protein 2-like isoform X1 n=1 Tax=Branchiostoma belcheri TaxID=7741 RepID=A0A6P4YWZ0_BRABE|nr:PREDICTED: GRB2-related adapter protein 2-like isoform X1 [Branchiostoma belcheri]KAI8501738.1 GRB2- adapter protein 2 [Branchiostoma belcheri]